MAGRDYIVLSYVDNILVIGSTAEITTMISRNIIGRCTDAGLRLNEHHPPLAASWTPPPSQQFEFLGELVDLAAGTVAQSEKTHHKVELVDLKNEAPITKRNWQSSNFSCLLLLAAAALEFVTCFSMLFDSTGSRCNGATSHSLVGMSPFHPCHPRSARISFSGNKHSAKTAFSTSHRLHRQHDRPTYFR